MVQNDPSRRIVITEEDIAPYVPEAKGVDVREGLNAVGQQVSQTARQVWESDARRQVTDKVRSGATAVAVKGSQVVRDKLSATAEQQARAAMEAMQSRLQQTDWKKEAQTGAVRGLRWMSQQLGRLAERFTPREKRSHHERP